MDFARLAAFQHQADLGARPGADQVVMDGGHHQQRRDRRFVGIEAAIGQDDEVARGSHGIIDVAEKRFQRALESCFARFHGIMRREGRRFEAAAAVAVEVAQLVEFVVVEDWRLELHLAGGARRRLEQVALAADGRLHRHDEIFADAVHRRIGHLGEELLEVVVEELRLVRQDGQRRVVAHRADGLVAVALRPSAPIRMLRSSRRIAERPLPLQHLLVVRFMDARPIRQQLEGDEMLPYPVAIRFRRRQLLLQFVVADDAALLEIDHQHLARLETALALDALRRNVEDADLGRHDDQAVFRNVVARRPQTIPIQRGANANAVGESHRRRPVPRLHERRMEFVERPLLLRHRWIAAPRLGDHHHHGVRQRPASQHQQFQHVVEHRRVAAGLIDDR